jgi:hypothetical protein
VPQFRYGRALGLLVAHVTPLTEFAHRKPRCLSGSAEAVLRGFRPTSRAITGSASLCLNIWEDTFAPCQFNTVCRFHGKTFPWGKAVTSLGRGALRLSQSFVVEPSSPGDGVNVQSAGAPPSGAKQQPWKKQDIRLLA